MFGQMKQEFSPGDFVRTGNTSCAELDGLVCRVLGKNTEDVCDSYIILFPKIVYGKYATVITEACLEPCDASDLLKI